MDRSQAGILAGPVEVRELVLYIVDQAVLGGDGIRLEKEIVVVVVRFIDQLLEVGTGGVVHLQVLEQSPDALYYVEIELSLLKRIDFLQPVQLDCHHNGSQESGGKHDPF